MLICEFCQRPIPPHKEVWCDKRVTVNPDGYEDFPLHEACLDSLKARWLADEEHASLRNFSDEERSRI